MTQQCHWDAENVPLLALDGGLVVHYICDNSWRYTSRMYALFWTYIYFSSNVYFKQTKKVKQYHCITKAIIHTHSSPWFLLLEPLSSLCFLLINVIFSSNGLTLKLRVSISDRFRCPHDSTSDYTNIFFLLQPGVFPKVDHYTICSLQCTPAVSSTQTIPHPADLSAFIYLALSVITYLSPSIFENFIDILFVVISSFILFDLPPHPFL